MRHSYSLSRAVFAKGAPRIFLVSSGSLLKILDLADSDTGQYTYARLRKYLPVVLKLHSESAGNSILYPCANEYIPIRSYH